PRSTVRTGSSATSNPSCAATAAASWRRPFTHTAYRTSPMSSTPSARPRPRGPQDTTVIPGGGRRHHLHRVSSPTRRRPATSPGTDEARRRCPGDHRTGGVSRRRVDGRGRPSRVEADRGGGPGVEGRGGRPFGLVWVRG